MRSKIRIIIKGIFYRLPRSIRRLVLSTYENTKATKCIFLLKKEGVNTVINKNKPKNKINVLFYHISGLSFGGTEKFLQILAKHINKQKYDVYFMYSNKTTSQNRISYLNDQNINFIEFDYDGVDDKYPYFVKGMTPSFTDVLNEKKIDLIVTPGSGFSQSPFNVIKNIPIFMLNIFGSPNTQKNIVNNICISNEVASKIRPIVNDENIKIMYIPTEKPHEDFRKKGLELRQSLGLKETDMVFGRIGRADNGIFDPIGINAFKEVLKTNSNVHYLIQSPPPILIKIVKEENIPNVHFLEPTSEDEKIWAFHFAIDALAHFRNDGESCGLNIIESMMAGKPIISHKSHIWNAHLEYLEPTFSRIAEKDDFVSYAKYMNEFIELKKSSKIDDLGVLAKNKSNMFLIQNNIERFEKWIDESISAIL